MTETKKECINCFKLLDKKIKNCPDCGCSYPTKKVSDLIKAFSVIAIIILFISLFFPPLILLETGVIYFFIKTKKDLKNAQNESLLSPQKKPVNHTKQDADNNIAFNKFNMENGVATIWQGFTKKASFSTFDKKVIGIITQVTIHDDGEFYIYVTDEETGEIETIKEKEIRTKIKVGSTSYDFMDLCKKPLKLNLQRVFIFLDQIRAEARKPILIKTFPQVEVTFTYESKQNGQTRRTISATKYYQNKEGADYVEGYCNTRKEERLFKAKNIKSKLKIGTKYYFFNEFIDQFVNK